MGRGRLFFCIVLASFIYVSYAFGPSSFLSSSDAAELQRAISSTKGSSSLKNGYYSSSVLRRLKADIDKSKCTVPAEVADKEEAFYAIAVADACGTTASEKIVQTAKSGLTSSNFRDLYFGLSAALVLRSKKQVEDKEILSAVSNLLKLKEDDGTFRPTVRDDPTTLNGVLALQVLGQVASDIKLDDNTKSDLKEVLQSAQDLFESYHEEADVTLHLEDFNSKATTLRLTSLFFKGFTALAKALGEQPDTPSKEQISKIAEFFIQRKSASNPEDAFFVLEGLHAAASNTLGVPVVVSLATSSIFPSGKPGEGYINMRVTDVLGSAVASQLILRKAYPSHDENKVLISNQEVSQEAGVYKLNFFAAKPEPGFYKLELRATPEKDGFIGAESVIRDVKVLTSVSVVDAVLAVSDSSDVNDLSGASKYNVDFGKSVEKAVAVGEGQNIIFNFKLRNQAGKSLSVQQAFLRISNNKNEYFVVSKTSGKFLSAQINTKDIRSAFLAENGTYSLELIIGDSFIHNPTQWKIASLAISFSGQTRYEAPTSAFAAKPEIAHVFRQPEPRPNESVSFAFSLACIAPILIFLGGLLKVGANAGNFPSGGASLSALLFQGCIGAILGLYALYWFRLNMMQTLQYLLVLSVPTLFFGVKTLNALSAASVPKTKKE